MHCISNRISVPANWASAKGHNKRQSSVKESSLWKRTGGRRQSLSQPTRSITDPRVSHSHRGPFSTSTTGTLSPPRVRQLVLFWRPSLVHLAMTYLSKSFRVGEMRPCWQHSHCKFFPAGTAAAYHKACRRQALGWWEACSRPTRIAWSWQDPPDHLACQLLAGCPIYRLYLASGSA